MINNNSEDRMLDIYHMPVVNLSSKKIVCYLWHEGLGVRGANEVSSCLSNFFTEYLMPLPISHLCVSTTCIQDLSFALFIKLVSQHKSIQTIVVKKVDIAIPEFGLRIEEKRRETVTDIHHPNDWQRLIEGMKINEYTCTVKQMKRENFLDFQSLFECDGGPLQMPHFNTDGGRLSVRSVQWFQFCKSKPFEVQYKKVRNEDAPLKAFTALSFKANDFDPSVLVLQPRILNETSRAISLQKKVKLCNVLHLINPLYYHFYNSLPVAEEEDVEDLVNEQINLEDSGVVSGEEE